MPFETLTTELAERVLTITLNRPDRMNALTTKMLEELLQVFDEIDRASLDLEALRFHIPADGLEKAVRSLIKAGGRELRGTRIFETTVATVR